MAYPDPPEITYSYTGFSQSLGDASFPGPQIDTDFANLVASLTTTTAFIQTSFRSDGVLKVEALPPGVELQSFVDAAEDWAIVAGTAAGNANLRANAAEAFAGEAGQQVVLAEQWADAAAASAGSIDVSGFMQKSSNLSDLGDTAAARTNLGLGGLVTLSSVDIAQLAAAVVSRLVPTGAVSAFLTVGAVPGWVKANGSTIGNVGSGAGTASADARALFDLIWAQMTNATAPILTSAGAASTRGASAAADWTAGKRMTLPDLRGEFIRGLDEGRGVDPSRALGSAQGDLVKAHTHTVTGTAASAGAHTHSSETGTGDNGTAYVAKVSSSTSSTATTGSAGAHTHDVTGTAAANTGAENRPRNVAWAHFIKL